MERSSWHRWSRHLNPKSSTRSKVLKSSPTYCTCSCQGSVHHLSVPVCLFAPTADKKGHLLLNG